MSIRSSIAVRHNDGSVSLIYCHNDGYFSYNGRILKEHYKDIEKVECLISFGDLSSLRENIGKTNSMKDHSFDNPKKDICIFYGRDRGETGVEPLKFVSLLEYFLQAPIHEYNYMFINNQWKIRQDREFLDFDPNDDD